MKKVSEDDHTQVDFKSGLANHIYVQNSLSTGPRVGHRVIGDYLMFLEIQAYLFFLGSKFLLLKTAR